MLNHLIRLVTRRSSRSARVSRPITWLGASVVIAMLVGAGPAAADTTYSPPTGTWNGYKIYVSKACHDGNDGVPGGPCITNSGCNSYSENGESNAMANTTIFGSGDGTNLLERGYQARKGDGTLSANISNSNQWGADMHIPLHSNAKTEQCSNTTNSQHGTWGLYLQDNDKRCANTLIDKVGPMSPGTTDISVYRDNLGELSQTSSPACYLEAEFHTWNKGVNWLQTEVDWTHRVGSTVDTFFNFP